MRRTRLIALVGLAVIAVLLPIAAHATGSSQREGPVEYAQSERVGCWDYESFRVGFRKKPGKCVFMRNGGTSSAESVYVTDMKSWKHWGAPTATVEGINRVNMGGKAPVVVELSKIKNRCGQRVYTKAKFTFPDFDSSSDLRLYSCKN